MDRSVRQLGLYVLGCLLGLYPNQGSVWSWRLRDCFVGYYMLGDHLFCTQMLMPHPCRTERISEEE